MISNILFQGFMKGVGSKGLNGIRSAPQNILLNTCRKGKGLKKTTVTTTGTFTV
jgi:hypothetical protein